MDPMLKHFREFINQTGFAVWLSQPTRGLLSYCPTNQRLLCILAPHNRRCLGWLSRASSALVIQPIRGLLSCCSANQRFPYILALYTRICLSCFSIHSLLWWFSVQPIKASLVFGPSSQTEDFFHFLRSFRRLLHIVHPSSQPYLSHPAKHPANHKASYPAIHPA